jgi:hypothetical protein
VRWPRLDGVPYVVYDKELLNLEKGGFCYHSLIWTVNILWNSGLKSEGGSKGTEKTKIRE